MEDKTMRNTKTKQHIQCSKHIAALLFGIIISFLYIPCDLFGTLHPETHLEFEEYVKYYGYPIERHEVITPDGYILCVFRLQSKENKEIKTNLSVVYLQHGLLDSSDTFILNEESKAPAFMLANRGYDVWLGNFRGNKHSRSHISLDPDSPHDEEARQFWNFSFHEMGVIDIPSIFAHIHRITSKKIHFIGHSQGSMAMFVALCEENLIVKQTLVQFIALGPIAYIQHVTRIYEFLPSTWMTREVFSRGCNILPLLCSYAYGYVGSHDPLLDQNERYDVISAHIPAGTSLMNMIHFHQLIITHQFKRIDHGTIKNLKIYGQPTPPFYDFSKIIVPVALFFGSEDRLADKKDVLRLKGELVNVHNLVFREIHSGHTSFLWGKDMSYFNQVFHLLETHVALDRNIFHNKKQFQFLQSSVHNHPITPKTATKRKYI